MKLEIDMDAMDASKLDALLAALNAWKMARFGAIAAVAAIMDAKPGVASNPGSSEPAATSPVGDPVGLQSAAVEAEHSATTAAEVVTEKPKRARKAAPAAEPAAGEPEPESPAADITIDELRGALQRLTAEKGMPAGIALLKEYDCNRVSELAAQPQATQRRFLAECPAAAKEAA